MTSRRRLLQATAALPLALALPGVDAMPAQTVVWSGFPPGGLGDQITRPLLERLKGRWPGAMLLDSKPGAGGRIAADFVKRAAPDGATLLQLPSSPMTIYPHSYGKRLGYDPVADFVAVTPLAAYTLSMTVGPGVPADVKTAADFVRWAKANPDKANYGIPAPGSVPHFVGMMFERAAGVPMKSIPYKGGAPLLQDLMGGQVAVAFNVVSEVLPMCDRAGCARWPWPAPSAGPRCPTCRRWSSWATRTSSPSNSSAGTPRRRQRPTSSPG